MFGLLLRHCRFLYLGDKFVVTWFSSCLSSPGLASLKQTEKGTHSSSLSYPYRRVYLIEINRIRVAFDFG